MPGSIRKGNLNPVTPAGQEIGQNFIDQANSLSLNFAPTAPSQWYQSFGFDDLRAATSEIRSTAIDRGWSETTPDSIARMRELNRAEDLTNLDDKQLDRKYNYMPGRGGMTRRSGDNRPTLEEFGITEKPTLLQPDEANSKYGLSGYLSWDKPVSSLVAEIQHKRKLEEIKQNNVFSRAQGFVDNSIGFGLTMGTALLDPIGLAVGFVPVLGEARYAKLGVTAGRFFRGAEAGLVGSAAVEPFIYAAKTQEKADYSMVNSIENIAFGAVGGGGLFVVGGKVADAFKGFRQKSQNTALEQAIKQLNSGLDVEVQGIATHGAASTKPIAVNIEAETPVPLGVNINQRAPGAPVVETPGAIVRDFKPYEKPATPEVEVQQKKSWLDFFSLKKNSPLDKAVEAIGRALPSVDLANVFKDSKLSDAIQAAKQSGISNKVAFYVKTADGQLMLARPSEHEAASLLKSGEKLPDGPVDMSKLSTDMTKLLSEHGLLAGENFGVQYKGSYKLDEDGITHVIQLDNVKFDPEKNQKYVVFGPEQTMKNLLSEDPSAAVFSDLNPKGAAAVNYMSQDLGSFLADADGKYKSYAGYDETKDVTQLKQVGEQQGTNKGGVFEDKKDGSHSYVKFQDANHSLNEWIAATLYKWFDVPMPNTTLVTEKGITKGVASDWVYGTKPLSPAEFNKLDDATRQAFIKHFLIDAYLGNWDVVGNGPNWNMMILPNGEVMRLDPGGALLYRAQGAEKGSAFGATIDELTSLQNSSKNPTAAEVFKNISIKDMDDAAYRVLKIPQEQINGLIDTAVAHGLDPNLGVKLKETLQQRRYQLEIAYKDAAVKAAKEQGLVKFLSKTDALAYLKGYGDELKAKLTKEEFNTLMSYTGSMYSELNTQLWKAHTNGTPVPAHIQHTADLLDSAFDKVAPLKDDLSVWRGNIHHTTFNAVFQQLGLNVPSFKAGHSTDAQMAYQMLKQAEGALIEMGGYTSTSFSYTSAKAFHSTGKTVMAQIEIPAGQKVLMAGAVSGFTHETEVILPRGTQLRVKQVLPGTSGGQPTLVLEVVEKGSQKFMEIPDAQALKIAQSWREKAANAAETSPLWYEPKDAVGDTLKGKVEDLNVINNDINDLNMQLDAHLSNADPEMAKLIKSELETAMKAIGETEASAKDLYNAAQAAAVCITKGS